MSEEKNPIQATFEEVAALADPGSVYYIGARFGGKRVELYVNDSRGVEDVAPFVVRVGDLALSEGQELIGLLAGESAEGTAASEGGTGEPEKEGSGPTPPLAEMAKAEKISEIIGLLVAFGDENALFDEDEEKKQATIVDWMLSAQANDKAPCLGKKLKRVGFDKHVKAFFAPKGEEGAPPVPAKKRGGMFG